MRLLARHAAGRPSRPHVPPRAPTATIANGSLRATVYLPDAKTGYYRGTRFDWSGPVVEPDVEGARVLRPVVRTLRPALPRRASPDRSRSSCAGDSAVGYAEAQPGGTVRPDRRRRAAQAGRGNGAPAVRPYEIVDAGKWTTNTGRTG